MIPEIIVCPIKRLYTELEKNIPDRNSIAIFLTTEEIDRPILQYPDDYIKLCVMDTESEDNIRAFSLSDGIKVKEFLENKKVIKRIYVCCDSGESRSTAMAAALMKYYRMKDYEIWKNPHYHPNLLVYRKQMEAFGFKISNLKLKYLKYLSDSALKKAIKRSRK